VDAFGGPEVLKLQEVAVPKVTPGTLLVRLKAVGVNPIETYIRAGAQNVELPYIPGTDGAGVVEEVGDGVTSFKKGDKVFVCGTEKGSGTYAEYCLSSKDHVRPLSRSFEAGAAVGIPYRTAYRALNQVTSVSKDESLLIHGSSGAVGIACLQLAKVSKCPVFSTARASHVLTTGGFHRSCPCPRTWALKTSLGRQEAARVSS